MLRGAPFLLVFGVGLCLGHGLPGLLAAEPLELHSTPIALDPGDSGHTRVGRLEWRGGLHLQSPEPTFGGWSGLYVSADGAALVAVGDEGRVLRAQLQYDDAGRLVGIDQTQIDVLLDLHGVPLNGKVFQDAESLARLPDGSWVVGFERRHRLWRYAPGVAPASAAEPFDAPKDLYRAPANGGVEALTALPDGRLVIVSEEFMARERLRGWVRKGHAWQRFTYPAEGLLRPSGMTTLPSGDLLVLERGYSPDAGVTIRLRRVRAHALRKNAALEGDVLVQIQPPLTVDNFEGIAARRGARGETLVYLLSDDNFSANQRTLLLMFALDESVAEMRSQP
jgi:hypothetical protein